MVRLAFAWVSMMSLASIAVAADGVLEINQTCAGSSAGCFPGDTAGFPVSITQPGSYRLTGNLTVPGGNTTAVSSSAENVTIDLGGFAIRGPNAVNDTPSCSAGGTGIGIQTTGRSTVVRNGHVHGMGSHGVYLASDMTRIEGVIATHNCGDGLAVVGVGSVVVGSQANRNRNSGIVGGLALVLNSVAYDNMGHGIQLFEGSVLGSIIGGNRADGLSTSSTRTGVGQSVFTNNVGSPTTQAASLGCNILNGAQLCP